MDNITLYGNSDAPKAALPISQVAAHYQLVRKELGKRIIGQSEVVEQLLTAFFSGGHCLLVGVPGLAKTLLISTFSEVLGMDFNRIQFTPDLMPSDVTGTDVITNNDGERSFNFLTGPIFSNVILADEINRTPPKTQASLLEAMEEYQVTAAGQRYPLPTPFFVMATQNPIEQEGTYPLPIAALDRFTFKIEVDYPTEIDELNMLFATTSLKKTKIDRVLDREEVLAILHTVRSMPISDAMIEYAVTLVRQTRPAQTSLDYVREMVEVGGSPRAVQALILASKARAALQGREEPTGADIRAVALPSMRHRVVPSFHASADSICVDDIVRTVIESVPRPKGDPKDAPKESRKFSLKRFLLGEPKPRPFKDVEIIVASHRRKLELRDSEMAGNSASIKDNEKQRMAP